MPEEEKKKTLQEQVAEAIAQQQAALGAANTEYQQGAQSALDNFKTGQQAVIDETAQGYDAQRQAVSQAYENIYGENGILGQAYKEREQRLKDEEARAAQEAKADYNSAKWSGITEVAASIANLIGVGALGASHQQYNLYSQDWMKKADANAKANRERIDRIRENLAAQKERLGQGRLQGALALSQLDREKLNQIAGMKGNLNQTEYKALLDSLGMGYQNRIAQANAGAQGALQGISLGLQEQNMREGRAIQRAQMAQSQKQFEATMRSKGFKPDGSLDLTSPIAQAALKAGSGSGGSKNILYYTDDAGNLIPVSMTSKEYDEFVTQSYASLQDNDEFKSAYRRAQNDTERKSIIFTYAIQNPERRAVLSQYGSMPETYKPTSADPPAAAPVATMSRRERRREERQKRNASTNTENKVDKTGLSNYL